MTAVLVAIVLAVAAHVLVGRILTRSQVSRRMRLVTGERGRLAIEETLAQQSAQIKGVLGRVLSAFGGLMPLGDEDQAKIWRALQRAGFYSANALTVVLGSKVACVLGGLAAGITVMVTRMPGLAGWGIGLALGLVLGVLLNVVPEVVVARLGARRMRKISAGLAEGFDLLIVCLEAGLTFERALQRAVRDVRTFHPALGEELGQVSLDMSVHGRTRADALGRLAARLEDSNFQNLATVVSQSERHGTPLADSLRKLAASMRVEAVARMQAKMARLPTLMVIPTVILVLPGIMVLVAGPALGQLTAQLSNPGG